MNTLPSELTRTTVLKFLSNAASYGNLGLFIGAGFSKAVLNDGTNDVALSWGQLLHRASEQLDVDYESIPKDGVSFPEIATRICVANAEANAISFSQALSRLKGTIANLTCWYPTREMREAFGRYIDAFAPAWVITTNYDLIIEAVLTGRSIPLGPNDQLSAPRGVTPVYHLHGSRTNPEEIIITQEDYVTLFRPNEYRQIKLALTVKESTTLLLGYGLGDVNVLTALDWSTNVFVSGKPTYPHAVIQVLRKENPREMPYRDKNGIVIVETNDLSAFFQEYIVVRTEELIREADATNDLDDLRREMADPEQEIVKKFVDNIDFRKATLGTLSKSPTYLISGFISLLDKCIDETWRRSAQYGYFEGYAQNLAIIIDILTAFEVRNMPPALFQTAAYALHRVAGHVGRDIGDSWAAADLWDRRKGELRAELVAELKRVANQNEYCGLQGLFDRT